MRELWQRVTPATSLHVATGETVLRGKNMICVPINSPLRLLLTCFYFVTHLPSFGDDDTLASGEISMVADGRVNDTKDLHIVARS